MGEETVRKRERDGEGRDCFFAVENKGETLIELSFITVNFNLNSNFVKKKFHIDIGTYDLVEK